MNFDFSNDQKQLRDQARKFLAEKCPPKAVRAVLAAINLSHGRRKGLELVANQQKLQQQQQGKNDTGGSVVSATQ